MRHEIDTSEWKEFKVGTLFTMFKPPVLHDRQVLPSANGLPYVVRTKFKNGIKDLVVTDEPVDPSPAGVVTWGSENASFFRQELPFYSGRDIYYLDTRQLSGNACRFLTAVLDTITSRYPYNYGLFPDLLKEELIKLPVTPSGDPDWAYMDAYMSGILTEEQAYADELAARDFTKHEIDTSEWKEFKVGTLFTMFKPPVLHDRQVLPSANGLPYVVRTKFKNGIKDLVVTDEPVDPSPAGVVTWGSENASFFRQELPFYSGRDIYYLDTRQLSGNACRFLTAVLDTITSRYPYNYGLFPDLLKEELIKLPVTPSGDPDWAYMDAYMSGIMAEEKAAADELTAKRD